MCTLSRLVDGRCETDTTSSRASRIPCCTSWTYRGHGQQTPTVYRRATVSGCSSTWACQSHCATQCRTMHVTHCSPHKLAWSCAAHTRTSDLRLCHRSPILSRVHRHRHTDISLHPSCTPTPATNSAPVRRCYCDHSCYPTSHSRTPFPILTLSRGSNAYHMSCMVEASSLSVMTLMAAALLFASVAALAAQQAAAAQLPDSYVLLPLTAFDTNNATALVAAYHCTPTYASTPCSGHGSCYLLLDGAANASQPFLQAAATQPLLVGDSALDTAGLDSATPLPAGVCVCEAGWSGRGDYISHWALSGDSCQVQQSAVAGLCITGIVLFSMLIVLALHRLLRWHAWHLACLSTPNSSQAVAAGPDTRTSDRPSESSDADSNTNATLVHVAPPPLSPNRHTRPATSTLSINVAVRQTPYSKARTLTSTAPYVPTTQSQRQALWLKNVQHITFVHPFCSLIVGGCVLAYYVLRLSTTATIGSSYIMSALMYVQHQPFCVAITMGTANNLSLAAAFTRTTTGATGLSTVIRAAKRYLMGLCVYSLFGWLLVWFVPAYPSSQQTLGVLVLLLGFLPDLLIGPISVTATRRVTAALVRHLELLSVEHQNERRTAYKKLRSFAYIITAVVTVNAVFCLIFVCSAELRQSGLPLFALAWHLTIFFILLVRLLLLRPPVRNGAFATAVHPASPVAAATAAGRVVGGSTAVSGGKVPTLVSVQSGSRVIMVK